MENPWTGEVAVVIDGEERILKLTLGALASLEHELGAGSLVSLVERFESGGFSSTDVVKLLQAGLRGNGQPDIDLITANIRGGPMAAARAAAELLARTFMLPGEET